MIVLKPATVKDVTAIQGIASKTWPGTYGTILSGAQITYMIDLLYSTTELSRQISHPGYYCIMAYENDNPAGFALSSSHEDDPQIFHLHKLYVLPEMQGKQVGKMLLDDIVSKVRSSGGTALHLNVNRFNKALNFYKKQGFEILREEDIDIGNGYFMNDYVMGKEV